MPKRSALDVAKTISDVASLIFVKDDQDAKKLLVAWTLYNPPFTDAEIPDTQQPNQAFDRLWSSQEPVDHQRLAQIAGLPYLLTQKLFARLVTARLVLPDGSVSHNVRIIIDAEMQGYLKAL